MYIIISHIARKKEQEIFVTIACKAMQSHIKIHTLFFQILVLKAKMQIVWSNKSNILFAFLFQVWEYKFVRLFSNMFWLVLKLIAYYIEECLNFCLSHNSSKHIDSIFMVFISTLTVLDFYHMMFIKISPDSQIYLRENNT